MKADEREDRVDPEVRKNTKCTIYLSYTSNMISSGIRETICFLVKHKMVSVLYTGTTQYIVASKMWLIVLL